MPGTRSAPVWPKLTLGFGALEGEALSERGGGHEGQHRLGSIVPRKVASSRALTK
jgi:hypothetical protein